MMTQSTVISSCHASTLMQMSMCGCDDYVCADRFGAALASDKAATILNVRSSIVRDTVFRAYDYHSARLGGLGAKLRSEVLSFSIMFIQLVYQ